jgi:hypothetical protein
MTGFAPLVVDHLNGDRSDNRFSNLRDVDQSRNLRNRVLSSNNKSGVVGVFWNAGRGRWTARIKINGKNIHIGTYKNLADAAAARVLAEREYGFTERHGTVPEDKFAYAPKQRAAA